MPVKKIDQVARLDLIEKESIQAKAEHRARQNKPRDQVDAINQMFAEFELAYHNQYHKAFPDVAAVNLAKKYWLSCLADIPAEVLIRATRELVLTQNYLPSVASMMEICRNAATLFGLPDSRTAYLEACRLPSPKASQRWSHPAVYLAGRQTGWFELANLPESQVFPLFDYHYTQFCQAVLRGEELDLDQPKAIPEHSTVALSAEDNLQRLHKLKKALSGQAD